MIRQIIIILLAGLFLPIVAKAQLPDTLDITWHKTTWLVFESPILSVDRGAAYVMAQQEAKNKTMLKVKAGQKGFPESNLTVLTEAGLHAFTIRYSDYIERTLFKAKDAFQSLHKDNPDTLMPYVKAIREQTPYLTRGDRYLGAGLYLQGIYVKDSLMFFDLLMINQSPFNYTIEDLSFTEEDRKKAKRTATYEEKHLPVATYYAFEEATPAGQWQNIVAVLPAFTLSKDRRMQIRMMEKGGGRPLEITLPARLFKKATRLPDSTYQNDEYYEY